MTNNDALRSIRYILNANDLLMVEIMALGGADCDLRTMMDYLERDDSPNFISCPDEMMARFLNGLVSHKRGVDPTRPTPQIEIPVTNNQILKRIRVAFKLTDEDILSRLMSEGLPFRKSELNALFRKENHENFRTCGDQILKKLFKSLSK